jgi:hypothetical protein
MKINMGLKLYQSKTYLLYCRRIYFFNFYGPFKFKETVFGVFRVAFLDRVTRSD